MGALDTGIEGRAVFTNNGYEDFVIAVSPDVPQEKIYLIFVIIAEFLRKIETIIVPNCRLISSFIKKYY